MANPRVLIVRAPGTNCDVETAYAFERFGASTHITAIVATPTKMPSAIGLKIHHPLPFVEKWMITSPTTDTAIVVKDRKSTRLNSSHT